MTYVGKWMHSSMHS